MARWLALGAASLLSFNVHAQIAFDLSQLTTLLAKVKSSEAVFTEKRMVNILAQTLESSGRLSFTAPDTFVRETLKPRQEKMAVIGNNVTLSSGSRSRTVPLDSVPEAAVIVEALRGTLTGNRQVLERHFGATVSGNAQRWVLELVPIEPRLRELVSFVQLSGQQSLVREVTIAMADGDRSVMKIEPVLAPAASSRPASTPASN
ncbi:MAG: outer membrane lipoprotein carrier protein LolA [Rhizobacter sp.]|nr:outer membrane lipoprotein carrier protein LolA [Rhizobacter sp.]